MTTETRRVCKRCGGPLFRTADPDEDGLCLLDGTQYHLTPLPLPEDRPTAPPRIGRTAFRLGPRRQSVLALLKASSRDLTAREIAKKAHIDARQVRDVLTDLLQAGYVETGEAVEVVAGWTTKVTQTWRARQ